MARTYLIIQSSDIDSVDFSQVCETSADTVRHSVDTTKTFVKWDGDEPSLFLVFPTQKVLTQNRRFKPSLPPMRGLIPLCNLHNDYPYPSNPFFIP